MKLVDILARELKVFPESYRYILFDGANRCYAHLGPTTKPLTIDCSECTDEFAVQVYKAQWQAAVDALKDEQITYSAESVSINSNRAALVESSDNPECKIIQPAWNGEGLPPVGATVEIHCGKWNIRACSECFLGIPVTVAAVFKMKTGTAMIAVDGGPVIGCEVFRADLARPVRMPEQIAAEERTLAVEQMVADLRLWIVGPDEFIKCGSLYDAGYRKFEIVEE